MLEKKVEDLDSLNGGGSFFASFLILMLPGEDGGGAILDGILT